MLFSVPLCGDSFSDISCLWQPWHLEDFRLGFVKDCSPLGLFDFSGLHWECNLLEKDYRDRVTSSYLWHVLSLLMLMMNTSLKQYFPCSSTVELFAMRILPCPHPQGSSWSTPIANQSVMNKKQVTVSCFEAGSHVIQAVSDFLCSQDWPWLWSSCLHLLSIGITGVGHQTQCTQSWGLDPIMCYKQALYQQSYISIPQNKRNTINYRLPMKI